MIKNPIFQDLFGSLPLYDDGVFEEPCAIDELTDALPEPVSVNGDIRTLLRAEKGKRISILDKFLLMVQPRAIESDPQILIIGASGWLGHYLIPEVLRRKPGTKIIAAYRSKPPFFTSVQCPNSVVFRFSATHGWAPNRVARTEAFLKKLKAGQKCQRPSRSSSKSNFCWRPS